MKLIELRGKHAVGASRYALVDDADFESLNQWRWKAKPNAGGNNLYAVRNVRVDGKWRTLRMHRELLRAADNELDVDHINHNPLDNRRSNLRLVTRSENIRNRKQVEISGSCGFCGEPFKAVVPLGIEARVKYCSSSCRSISSSLRAAPAVKKLNTKTCEQCGEQFQTTRNVKRYCAKKCIDAAAWEHRKKKGTFQQK